VELLEGRQVPASVKFAVIGDYGAAVTGPASFAAEQGVANLVKSWNPNFIVTVGDNNYANGSATTIDKNIGQFYSSFISPYTGNFGSGASTNKFWPAIGNHDWNSTAGYQPYLDYFQLPGNERYYTVARGPVQFFVLNSDPHEPDGTTPTSVQGLWLQTQLAASTALWKIVVVHHAPFSSGEHGSTTSMQWPFKQWGATAVLSGHDHDYERLWRNNMPYFVNGLGGDDVRPFKSIVAGSKVRYAGDYGAMLVVASDTQITFRFFTQTGTVIDNFRLKAPTLVTASTSSLTTESTAITVSSLMAAEETTGPATWETPAVRGLAGMEGPLPLVVTPSLPLPTEFHPGGKPWSHAGPSGIAEAEDHSTAPSWPLPNGLDERWFGHLVHGLQKV